VPWLHSGRANPIGRISAKAPDIDFLGVCERVQTKDPSPRLNSMLPEPDGEMAAA
jgi:hypothetical protein